MSPIVAVQYAPRCAVCGLLGGAPWMLIKLPDGHWDALCGDCSLALLTLVQLSLGDEPEST